MPGNYTMPAGGITIANLPNPNLVTIQGGTGFVPSQTRLILTSGASVFTFGQGVDGLTIQGFYLQGYNGNLGGPGGIGIVESRVFINHMVMDGFGNAVLVTLFGTAYIQGFVTFTNCYTSLFAQRGNAFISGQSNIIIGNAANQPNGIALGISNVIIDTNGALAISNVYNGVLCTMLSSQASYISGVGYISIGANVARTLGNCGANNWS